MTPAKLRAVDVTLIVHGGSTTKVIGITSGLPTAVCPALSVAETVTNPV